MNISTTSQAPSMPASIKLHRKNISALPYKQKLDLMTETSVNEITALTVFLQLQCNAVSNNTQTQQCNKIKITFMKK
jgi:hypothetical protein